MDEEVRYFGHLEKLVIEPGDRFVLQLDVMLNHEQVERIQAHWREFVGKDVPILILQRGMKLGAIQMPQALA